MKGGFRFRRLSEKQKQVLCWWTSASPVRDANGIIADGAIRSGKTVSMALGFLLWAMTEFDDQNFALCGKTVGSLRRNVVAELSRMAHGRGFSVKDKRSENLLLVRNGRRENRFYLFGGKDEGSQDLIQGLTLAGALFDEVALMPESFVNQATARCSVSGAKWWFNCNPAGPMHWFKTGWIDQREKKGLLYLHFTMEDNLSLSDAIRARYRGQYQGVFYRRYILGQWAMADGLVYPGFDPARHVRTELPPEGGEYYISVDYGTKNPFSAGLWQLRGGTAVRLREYYYDGRKKQRPRTDEEHYAALEQLAGGLPVRWLVIDPSASSMIEVIRRHGKFRVKQADNDVLAGIANTATFLEQGRLQFMDGCADCIREFGQYQWDEKSRQDRVVKEYDHAMDDVRYFCRTVLRREVKFAQWEDER